MLKKNLIKQAFLCLGLIFSSITGVQATHLYLLSNHSNAGEHNQVLGIKEAFHTPCSDLVVEDLNVAEKSSTEIANKMTLALARDKVIVVAVGEPGAEAVKELPLHPHLTICLMAHMPLKSYEDSIVINKANFVALPIHAVSTELKDRLGSKLIETVGVSHNRKKQNMEEVYVNWKSELPTAKSYLVVILGGDAPSPGSKVNKFFGLKDAKKLADYIVKHRKPDEYLIVLNGPRTGKFKPDQQEDMTVHRQGYSDPVTESFITHLKNKGIKDFKVFDFQHKTPENQNYVLPFNSFDLAVGAVCSKGGSIFVPGESTSMISEMRDLLPPEKVVVYEHKAMSEVHQAHVQSEIAAGKIAFLKGYTTVLHPTEKKHQSDFGDSAATTIAKRLSGQDG